MESTRPENGLMIEQRTLTKGHGVAESRGKVRYNGSGTDAIEFHIASQPATDLENLQCRENSPHCLRETHPGLGGSVGDGSAPDLQVCSQQDLLEERENLDQCSDAVRGMEVQDSEQVFELGDSKSRNITSEGESCDSESQYNLPIENNELVDRVTSFCQHSLGVGEPAEVTQNNIQELKKINCGDKLPILQKVFSDELDRPQINFADDGTTELFSSAVSRTAVKQIGATKNGEAQELLRNDAVLENDNVILENRDEYLDNRLLSLQPQIFEDITEDEDSDSEVVLENIELQPDDFGEPVELSRSACDTNKETCDKISSVADNFAVGQAIAEFSEPTVVGNSNIENVLAADETLGTFFKSNGNTATTEFANDSDTKTSVTNADDGHNQSDSSISLCSGQGKFLEKQEKQENIDTFLSSTFNSMEIDHKRKQKFTARKTGRPVTQTESTSLKTINLHPIKNITMKLSDIESALDCDPLRDKTVKVPKVSEISIGKDTGTSSLAASAFNLENGATETLTSRKKKRKNKDNLTGTKRAKRIRLDGLESQGLSADVPSSGSEAQDDMQKNSVSQMYVAVSADSNSVHDVLTGSSFISPDPQKSPSIPLPLTSPSSSSAAATSSLSPLPSWSSTSPVKSPVKKDSKMKTVLDMLHARSIQKAELDERKAASNISQTVSITCSATSTTTTILVSPPPDKPIIEGVKRKGTPRKRKGKRRESSESSLTSSTSISAPQLQLTPQSRLTGQTTTSATAQPPVVMVVAQHSSAPGLRSLLPRHSTVSQTDSSTGRIIQPSSGNKLGSLPLISTLPVGAKAISLANLPPGIAAVPGVSLCPGSQPLVTFFTTVPTTAVPVPISGANLVSVTSPKQLMNTASPGKTVKSVASTLSGAQLLTLPTTKLSSSTPNSSDSLRGLLLGKPYSFTRVTSSASQLSPSPVLFQMVTTSGTSLVPVPAQPTTLTPAAVMPAMLKPSSSSPSSSSSTVPVSKSSYSLLKQTVPNVPNGISCLTPPKTPDNDSSAEVAASASLGHSVTDQSVDSEVIPLCCCKINGASFNKLSAGVTYCQALDTADNKVLGCCNKVTNMQLVRPGVKIPFMAVCETHRKRLKLHQSCPGCGHFCTQGKFQQCRKEGKSSVHNFHRQCVFYRGGKYHCPHCGEETSLCEVELQFSEKPEEAKVKAEVEKKTARGSSRNFVKSRSTNGPNSKSFTLPNKSVNLETVPLGPDQQILTRLFKCATEDRPKKYRTLVKDLYTPASEGDIEKVFYLLVDGMDPNTRFRAYEDQTAMHAAATLGSIGTVFLLKQFGAVIHAQDKNLRTPLMCAAENGHLKVVQFLIKAGAKVEDRGEDGMTGLHYAAKAGHIDIIQHILDTGRLDVNIQDDGGWTPIIWATESQLPNVVKYLLENGGDPNKKDNEENTGLHWAAFSGSVEIAQMFLDVGCEIDAVNEHGDRPLHISARQEHYDIVVLLLARGASVDTKNNKDKTPLESCVNKSGQVWTALKVNLQLRSFATQKLIQPERLLERDITMGREKLPIACVNAEDMEPYPADYLYVSENVVTSSVSINHVITSLRSCQCTGDCSSVTCTCSHSSVKCCYDKGGRLLEEIDFHNPPLVFECNRACRCWMNCKNRVVQNGVSCRLHMFRTADKGWGVRTLMDIPRGTFVCEYVGELVSDSDAERRADDSYLFDLDTKDGDLYCIDARMYGNISRFINHQCEPNLAPVKVFVEHQDLRFPRICLFSCRDIKAYEELGYDYGEKFWLIKHKQFTCACKSSNCRYSMETVEQTLANLKLHHSDVAVDV